LISSYKKIFSPSLEEEILRSFEDLEKCEMLEASRRCGIVYLGDPEKKGCKRFVVNVLNKTFSVDIDKREVLDLILGKPAPKELSLIIVRYITYSTSGKVTDTWVTYEKIPGAKEYLELFRKLVIRPLVRVFGENPEKYEIVCKRLGGKKERLGGISYSFLFLPKIQLLTQLWKAGREEYSTPMANLSFNSSVKHYLSARDLLIVGKIMVEMMEAELKKIT